MNTPPLEKLKDIKVKLNKGEILNASECYVLLEALNNKRDKKVKALDKLIEENQINLDNLKEVSSRIQKQITKLKRKRRKLLENGKKEA